MKVLQTRVMRGPNYWSIDHPKLIVVKLNLTESELLSVEKIPEYGEKIASLNSAFQSLKYTQSLYELIALVALGLQRTAGMDGTYYSIHPTKQRDTQQVAFSYLVENAGLYAAEAAVKLLNAVINGSAYDLENDIQKLSRINRRENYGPSTQSLVDEALKWDIPVTRIDDSSLVMLGHGAHRRIIRAAIASTTSTIGVELVGDKEKTKKVLAAAYVPTPRGTVVCDLEELKDAIDWVGFPLVIKPLDGNHGRGITTNLRNYEDAVEAFEQAKQISKDVIVEKHIFGSDFRFLVVNYKLVAVAKRTPAKVTGDGTSTIRELVDQTNTDPRRGSGHEKVLTKIYIDANTLAILEENNLTPDSVLPEGKTLFLKDTANISTGGTADDVTDEVHPQNVFLAQRIAGLTNMDICGIDIMAEDITVPLTEKNGAVIEVNACPGLRMHLAPATGLSRNVAAPIIDMLFPPTAQSRIPIVAITGTNGKTTTTRLIAHLVKQAGFKVGFTTSDGITIGDHLITEGDCSGPASAAVVLKDPFVDFAVLECARGGILRSGLGFDKCNIGIVTNVTEDHLGLEGIETIEDLARVKAVVPQSVSASGYAILNADDDLVYQMKDTFSCNIALFSLSPNNPRIKEHVAEGKLVAFVEDEWFTISKGEWKHRIIKVEEVPLTLGGKSESMIKNILPSILTAFIHDFSVENIQIGLKTFIPSPENTPGRMNVFDFKSFKVVLDYAHNIGGYQELIKYASQVTASVKTGVIAVAGDRRDQDIRHIGSLAAEIFDQIIIRHNKDKRGRSDEENTALLMEGIRKIKSDLPVKVISDEFEATQYAIDHAEKDAWIFIVVNKVQEALAYVSKIHQNSLVNTI